MLESFLATHGIDIAFHALVGSIGGALYVLRQHLKGYLVRGPEYLARPVFGAAATVALNASLGFPDHNLAFCVFVGYSGVDVWDTVAEAARAKLPLSAKHEKAPTRVQDDASGEQGEPRLEM